VGIALLEEGSQAAGGRKQKLSESYQPVKCAVCDERQFAEWEQNYAGRVCA
jgi:hypothetical protein